MASTVLPNGIIVPEKFSRDWYADLYHNWQELDNLLGGGTPKDGTLTIQKNGDTVGTFSANQATDETINITVPDVNDATLTIQQNGTTVDTFTANSSSDKTANIQCVDLTNNQTVAGNKEFTGTTTAHDVIPSATDTYNLGSSSAQWNNAYIKSLTINGVAAGDILTHNASEFVGVSGNQTIGGQKTFSHGQTGVGRDIYHFASNPYGKNTPPTNTSYQYVWFVGNTASQGFANSWYSGFIEQVVSTDGSARGSWVIRNTSDNKIGIQLSESADGSSSSITPLGSTIDLGTSTNKWKSFNGLNPGALSLPSNSYVNVDTTNWDLTNYTTNSYTPPTDGWIMLGGYADVIQIDGTMKYGITANKGYDGYCEAFLPVFKDSEVRCRFRNCTTLNNAKFFPCQGNV